MVFAAAVLAIGVRQTFRLLAQYQEQGGGGFSEHRYVGQQLTLSYDRKQIILERSALSENLAGQYVELYDFPDRPMEVRWKGHSLPYRVFNKDQRVSPPLSWRTSVSAMRCRLSRLSRISTPRRR